MRGIITCMTCMLVAALTEGGPIKRQAAQSEKTVPIGGNVTLECPLVYNDLWKSMYWEKNNRTIYSLKVKSNTTWTNDPRYEGSNHATRLTIKNLKITDRGIYHCKVETLVFMKERGQVLLSVTGIFGVRESLTAIVGETINIPFEYCGLPRPSCTLTQRFNLSSPNPTCTVDRYGHCKVAPAPDDDPIRDQLNIGCELCVLVIHGVTQKDAGRYAICQTSYACTSSFWNTISTLKVDQEVGPPTTSPGVPFRASTTIPPQPAENDETIVFVIIISIFSIISAITSFIIACRLFKYWKRIKNLPAGLASALRRLAPRRTSIPLGPDSSHHEIRDKSVTSTSLLSSDTHDRDDVDVDDRPEGSSNASQAVNICKTDDGTIQQLLRLTLSSPI